MRAELGNRVSLSVASSLGTTSMRPIIGTGPKGADGSNVLPTDTAMANGVTNVGGIYPLFSAALSGAYIAPRKIVRASGGDDYAAIQAALDTAAWVHFPDPLYLVSAELVQTLQGQRLTGPAWLGATILRATTPGMRSIIRFSAARANMSDLDLDAASKANNAYLLHIANRSEFQRVNAYGGVTDGVGFDLDATGVHGNNNIAKFISCWSHNNAGHGWAVPTRDGDNNGIEWYGCEASSNNKSGILYKGSGGRVFGGIYQANRNYGIEIGEDADGSSTPGFHMYYPWLEANGQFTGSAMTNGSTTLTSTASGWRASMIGATVNVAGAGVAGATLVAKVVSINSLTSVVLDTAASTTVAGVLTNCPLNGVRASTKCSGAMLDASTAQQTVVGNESFGRCLQRQLGGNGEYDIIGAADRGVRLYGRSGTARGQVLPVGPDTDVRLDLIGKGAGGVQVEASGGKLAFFGGTPTTKATITGTRADGAALATLLTELAAKGLITDSSTLGVGAGGSSNVTGVALASDATPVNNSVTLVSTLLTLPVVASGIYIMELGLFSDASTAADISIKWLTTATGATMVWTANSPASNATVTTSATDRSKKSITQVATVGGITVGTTQFNKAEGTLVVSSTAGDLTLQYAQLVADATDAIIRAGSYLKLTKIN